MTLLNMLGLVATLFTTGAYLPQAYKIIQTKSTQSLSTPTYTMIVVGSVLWVVYAYEHGDMPVMLANGVTGLLSAAILLMKLTAKP